MDSHEIGRNIRLLRTQTGMSQEKLGELLELSYQQVQKYEAGRSKITVELLSKLSKIFSIGIEEILRGSFGEPAYHGENARDRRSYIVENIQEDELLREYRKLCSPVARDYALRWLRSIVELEAELRKRESYRDFEG